MIDDWGTVIRCPDPGCGNVMTLDVALDACPQCRRPIKHRMEALKATILAKARTETDRAHHDDLTDRGRDRDMENMTNAEATAMAEYHARRLVEERRRKKAEQAVMAQLRRNLDAEMRLGSG